MGSRVWLWGSRAVGSPVSSSLGPSVRPWGHRAAGLRPALGVQVPRSGPGGVGPRGAGQALGLARSGPRCGATAPQYELGVWSYSLALGCRSRPETQGYGCHALLGPPGEAGAPLNPLLPSPGLTVCLVSCSCLTPCRGLSARLPVASSPLAGRWRSGPRAARGRWARKRFLNKTPNHTH